MMLRPSAHVAQRVRASVSLPGLRHLQACNCSGRRAGTASSRVRILLTGVQERDNLNHGRLDAIHNQVVWMHNDFVRAGNTAKAVQVGMVRQL